MGTTHRPTQQGTPQQRRPRIRRPPVDPHGEHDQRCGFAVSLRRHDVVQSVLEKKIKRAGKAVRLATVHELRFGVAGPSQKKSDLYVTNMAEDGLPTIVASRTPSPTPIFHKIRPSVCAALP